MQEIEETSDHKFQIRTIPQQKLESVDKFFKDLLQASEKMQQLENQTFLTIISMIKKSSNRTCTYIMVKVLETIDLISMKLQMIVLCLDIKSRNQVE